MRAILLLALLALAGCHRIGEEPIIRPDPAVDQCLRVELFNACLRAVPAGPTTVKNNDWAEVVEECQHASYYQALRQPAFVKPECRP